MLDDDNNATDVFDFDDFMKKKGGVEDRLAFGVCVFAFLDLSMLLSLIPDINFWSEKSSIVVIFILGYFIAEVQGKKLSKHYNRDKNLNGYFYVIFSLVAGAFLVRIVAIFPSTDEEQKSISGLYVL